MAPRWVKNKRISFLIINPATMVGNMFKEIAHSLDILRRPQIFEKNYQLCFDVKWRYFFSNFVTFSQYLTFRHIPNKLCRLTIALALCERKYLSKMYCLLKNDREKRDKTFWAYLKYFSYLWVVYQSLWTRALKPKVGH